MNKVESALSRTTDTKALVIGIETLPRVADMFKELFPGRRALVVADANTWRAAGGDVHRILAQAGVAQDEPHVFTDPTATGMASVRDSTPSSCSTNVHSA